MSGNVFEWLWDWYTDVFSKPMPDNWTGAQTGKAKVWRGGA